MVENARNLIETQFSWDVVSERFIEIYRYALAGKPSEAEYKASNDI